MQQNLQIYFYVIIVSMYHQQPFEDNFWQPFPGLLPTVSSILNIFMRRETIDSHQSHRWAIVTFKIFFTSIKVTAWCFSRVDSHILKINEQFKLKSTANAFRQRNKRCIICTRRDFIINNRVGGWLSRFRRLLHNVWCNGLKFLQHIYTRNYLFKSENTTF